MRDEPIAALDAVYAAQTPEELGRAYAGWAADYDRETKREARRRVTGSLLLGRAITVTLASYIITANV
ncbi:hypothetical protein [Mesorhizobium sp. CAU 1732]|uniref:hypothetical protein n=1 Tax=Mesorhizobium sp. CAU 1732 TaxID=3140358 RepID=UPI003261C18A